MGNPSTRRSRFGGAVAVLALAVGSLLTAATPAAAVPSTTPCDWDPAGVIMLSSTTVVSGGQLTVSWNVTGISCPPTAIAPVVVQMSGPGFTGDETVPPTDSRLVTVTQPGPSTATWILKLKSLKTGGSTDLDTESASVTPLVNGLAGGAVAFSDFRTTETKAEPNSIVTSTGPPVRSDTSPSLFNVGNNYEAAYQGTDGHLWVVSPTGAATDTGLAMAAGTSPSITATDSTNFTVAFQAPTTYLWTYSSKTGARNVGLSMAPGTSPSATLTTDGVAIAYVDGNGNLCVSDPTLGFGGYGAPVAAGTSPAITYIPGLKDGYRIVYQAPDHQVRTADSTSAQTAPTPLTAATGTSPAITTLPTHEIDIAVNGTDLTVHVLASTGAVTNTNAPIRARTSPSIAPAADGGPVVAWQDFTNTVSTFSLGAGVTHTGLTIAPTSSPSIAQITSILR
jgi:hypothetical protein